MNESQTKPPSAAPGNTLLNGAASFINHLLALLLLAMVVMVFGNVVLRYVFNSGIAVSEELSRWAFVWLTFLGAIVALKEHAHLGTDVLTSRLPPLGKRVCAVLSLLLMLAVTWLIFSGSWTQVKINAEVEAPVTGWSMAVVYMAGVVFAVPAFLLLLREFWRVISGKASDAELAMTQESEDLAHLDTSGGSVGRGSKP